MSKEKPIVIVEVKDGVVQQIVFDHPDLDVHVVDYDVEDGSANVKDRDGTECCLNSGAGSYFPTRVIEILDELKVQPELNRYQRAAAEVYGGGDYSHVKTLDEAEDVGDTLFLYIMCDLDDAEDCENLETAVQRMRTAVTDVQTVINALHKLEV